MSSALQMSHQFITVMNLRNVKIWKSDVSRNFLLFRETDC